MRNQYPLKLPEVQLRNLNRFFNLRWILKRISYIYNRHQISFDPTEIKSRPFLIHCALTHLRQYKFLSVRAQIQRFFFFCVIRFKNKKSLIIWLFFRLYPNNKNTYIFFFKICSCIKLSISRHWWIFIIKIVNNFQPYG